MQILAWVLKVLVCGDSGLCRCCTLGALGVAPLACRWLGIQLAFILHSCGSIAGYEGNPFYCFDFPVYVGPLLVSTGVVLVVHYFGVMIMVFCRREVGQFLYTKYTHH